MKLYKLTDLDGYTRKGTMGETKWHSGKTVSISTELRSNRLCTPGVVHAYTNLNLALLINPVHANIHNPIIWESVGDVVAEDWSKVGCHELTTIRKLYLPTWYTDDKKRERVRVQFAVLCAESVIGIFEGQYPRDERPRKAIEAAEAYLANPNILAGNAAEAAARAAEAAEAAWAAWAARAARAARAAEADFAQLADEAVERAMR